ncbi:phage tail protein [Anaerosinus massiliensis]|uniref:phage tail protein n=1 Tax=Massilibacillus massiliensis TaxID=1806837 RepID=UPI000DA600A0|nr:phage tail protein [Massilibacillus massiliensis]
MNINTFLGWGLTTWALKFLNKRSSSSSDSNTADDLNVTASTTRVGEPIPVGFGTFLLKQPLVSHFGDFRADIYTETYAAHAQFSAWPMVFSLIVNYIKAAITGHQVGAAKVDANLEDGSVKGGEGGSVSTKVTGQSTEAKFKDDLTGPLINALFMWLLSWLINGRNLKTTIQKGFKYFLGYQLILCWTGPNIKLKKIYMRENLAWEGNISKSDCPGGKILTIDDDQLFGGPDESGGFIGNMNVYFGDEVQQKDPWMVEQMRADSVQAELRGLTPVYRSFLTIVVPQAYIGKSATIPETWIEVQNIYDGLGLGAVGEDNNPAEVIYEAYINQDWGLNESPDKLDIEALIEVGKKLGNGEYASGVLELLMNETDTEKTPVVKFTAIYPGTKYDDITIKVTGPKYAGGDTRCDVVGHTITIYCSRNDDEIPETSAQDIVNVINNDNLASRLVKADVLYNQTYAILSPEFTITLGGGIDGEGLGISGIIDSTITAKELITQICNHINAVRFLNPVTGKLTFKLIRNDYEVSNLFKLSTNNCASCEFSRLDWSETVSNITVAFTDSTNLYENSTIPRYDNANIAITNTRTNKTYDYTLFTTAQNALTAAERELTAQAYPLSTASIIGNRSLAQVQIGDPVVLSWPPYGIERLVMRVTDVDHGDMINGEIKVECVEDVFGFESGVLKPSDGSGWQPIVQYPTGVSFYDFIEVPYELSYSKDTYVYGIAARPTSITTEWKVWRKEQAATEFTPTSRKSMWSAIAELQVAYREDTEYWDYNGFEIKEMGNGNVIQYLESYATADISAARVGNKMLMIGDEIMAYSTINRLPNGNFMIQGIMRGVMDTVPTQHKQYELVYFLRTDQMSNVTGSTFVCKAGETTTEQYNITTASVDVAEDFDASKIRRLETNNRAQRPSPVGYLRVMNYPNQSGYTRYGDGLCGTQVKFRFTPRDKFNNVGAVAQDDIKNYYTAEKIINKDVNFIAKIYNDTENNQYVIDRDTNLEGTEDASQNFIYTWQNWCNDFKNSMMKEATIEFYQVDSNGLESYQAQVRNFRLVAPTIVAVLEESDNLQDDIAEFIQANVSSDRVFVQAGTFTTDSSYCMIDRTPLLVVGKKVAGDQPEQAGLFLLDQDGVSILPNKFYMFKRSFEDAANDGLVEFSPEDNYVFQTYYNPDKTGDAIYYRLENSGFINIGKTLSGE